MEKTTIQHTIEYIKKKQSFFRRLILSPLSGLQATSKDGIIMSASWFHTGAFDRSAAEIYVICGGRDDPCNVVADAVCYLSLYYKEDETVVYLMVPPEALEEYQCELRKSISRDAVYADEKCDDYLIKITNQSNGLRFAKVYYDRSVRVLSVVNAFEIQKEEFLLPETVFSEIREYADRFVAENVGPHWTPTEFSDMRYRLPTLYFGLYGRDYDPDEYAVPPLLLVPPGIPESLSSFLSIDRIRPLLLDQNKIL